MADTGAIQITIIIFIINYNIFRFYYTDRYLVSFFATVYAWVPACVGCASVCVCECVTV